MSKSAKDDLDRMLDRLEDVAVVEEANFSPLVIVKVSRRAVEVEIRWGGSADDATNAGTPVSTVNKVSRIVDELASEGILPTKINIPRG